MASQWAFKTLAPQCLLTVVATCMPGAWQHAREVSLQLDFCNVALKFCCSCVYKSDASKVKVRIVYCIKHL